MNVESACSSGEFLWKKESQSLALLPPYNKNKNNLRLLVKMSSLNAPN